MIDEQVKKAACKFFLSFVLFCGLFVISYPFMVDFYYVSSSYLHEGGHFAGSFLTDILCGNFIQMPYVKTWQYSPNFHIEYPQQTTVPDTNMNILTMVGGMFFGPIILTIICLILFYFYHFYPTKTWIILIPLGLLILQVVSNFYCGYDNPAHAPSDECNTNFLIHLIWIKGGTSFVVGLTLIFSFLLTKIVYERLQQNMIT
jgi:hypothetical protein